jgi:hypothetical protein
LITPTSQVKKGPPVSVSVADEDEDEDDEDDDEDDEGAAVASPVWGTERHGAGA